MTQKTIQLNPDFLSVGGKKKDKHNRTRKERKVRPTASVNPSKLRKEFLNRIKDHQVKTEKGENEKGVEDVKKDDGFNQEFNSSMDYLEKLSKERAEKKKQQRSMKRTKKQRHMTPPGGQKPEIFVNTELPKEMDMNTIQPPSVIVGEMPIINTPPSIPVIIQQPKRHNHTVKQQPLYSSLKNGSRPTFREMMADTTQATQAIPATPATPATPAIPAIPAIPAAITLPKVAPTVAVLVVLVV